MTFTPSTASMVFFSVISVGLFAQSDAHQSGSGWTYPLSCCNGKDFGGADARRLQTLATSWPSSSGRVMFIVRSVLAQDFELLLS